MHDFVQQMPLLLVAVRGAFYFFGFVHWLGGGLRAQGVALAPCAVVRAEKGGRDMVDDLYTKVGQLERVAVLQGLWGWLRDLVEARDLSRLGQVLDLAERVRAFDGGVSFIRADGACFCRFDTPESACLSGLCGNGAESWGCSAAADRAAGATVLDN